MMEKPITPNDFLLRLKQKVTAYNAKLVLHSAMVDSGINLAADADLSAEQFESLCLGLIRAGGPAFQVGQAMYREVKGTATQH